MADQIGLALAIVISALLLFGVVALMILVLQRVAKQRNRLLEDLGNIRCRRCHHVGRASAQFMAYRGMVVSCARCGSQNWETVRQAEVMDD